MYQLDFIKEQEELTKTLITVLDLNQQIAQACVLLKQKKSSYSLLFFIT